MEGNKRKEEGIEYKRERDKREREERMANEREMEERKGNKRGEGEEARE